MERPAPTDLPIHQLLQRRWSPRAFADKPVTREQLLTLLEAARWAPSSYNEQPWRFLIATKQDADEYGRMLGCLVEFNQSWAKEAYALMIAVASLKFARNGKPNRHAAHDVGLALQSLAVQATAMGIAVHMMAGFDIAKTRLAYSIDDDHEPITAVAIGHPGDPDSLSPDLKQKELEPRQRQPLNRLAFSGRLGQASAMLGF